MSGVTPNEPPFLAPGSFLTRISQTDRDDLLALGVTRTVTPGRHLLVEGAHDTHVELIRRGFVKITTSLAGLPRLLAIRLPGDIVGEFAAVTGNGRSATATACANVVSTVVHRAAFLSFLAHHPAVANQVTATVGERLRWANARRTDFAAFTVRIRLARILADIARSCGEPGGNGVRIGVELRQAELATLVGAAEDTVQRALSSLRRDRLITSGYRWLMVADLDRLEALASEAETGPSDGGD